jgi:hypothetical protein
MLDLKARRFHQEGISNAFPCAMFYEGINLTLKIVQKKAKGERM